MKYIIDTNSLNKGTLDSLRGRNDICVVQEVIDEYSVDNTDISHLRKSGLNILELTFKHIKRISSIVNLHGRGSNLIDLYSFEGQADVAILAYIIGEQEEPDSLFSEREYTIITNDNGLIDAAKSYNIPCVHGLD